MTQVVRQKWVLGLAGMNAFFVLGVLVVVGLSLRRTRAVERDEAAVRADALRAEVEGLRAELRSFHVPAPAAPDPQLAQTLQLLAAEQQTLLLRSLQPAPAAPAPVALADTTPPATKARKSSGRRSRVLRQRCAVH